MSDYSRQENFTAKDSLASGNPEKTILGADVDSEFDAALTAINSKADKVSGGTTGNLASLTSTGNLQDSGSKVADFTENADTDVSGNSWVLDEDDMSSDDASKVPTQQSVKAYVDTEVAAISEGMAMVAAASVGTGGDVSQALTGTVERIEVAFGNVSTNGTGDIRIQVGTGSTLTTSGYKSDATDAGSSNNSTAGFIIHARTVATNDTYAGVANLVHMGSNLWICSGTAFDATSPGQSAAFSGMVTLAGACDIVGIDTANSFDGGFWKVSYQTS